MKQYYKYKEIKKWSISVIDIIPILIIQLILDY